MRKSWLLAMSLSILPAGAFAMSNYNMGNVNFGNMQRPGMADLATAVHLLQKGEFADAIPYLKHALDGQPGSADILNLLGFTSRMVGKYDDSLSYYQRALARNPNHKGAHEYLGELYLTIHQLGNARGQLAELERICPDGCAERDTLTKSIADYEAVGMMPAMPQTTSSTAPQ